MKVMFTNEITGSRGSHPPLGRYYRLCGSRKKGRTREAHARPWRLGGCVEETRRRRLWSRRKALGRTSLLIDLPLRLPPRPKGGRRSGRNVKRNARDREAESRASTRSISCTCVLDRPQLRAGYSSVTPQPKLSLSIFPPEIRRCTIAAISLFLLPIQSNPSWYFSSYNVYYKTNCSSCFFATNLLGVSFV